MSNNPLRVQVVGPAYLDRVLRVDRRLADPPLDASVNGSLERAAHAGPLVFVDPTGASLTIELPANWPGPHGQIVLSRPLAPAGSRLLTETAQGLAWNEDLGGMGAGYAAAFGGYLTFAFSADLTGARIAKLLLTARMRLIKVVMRETPSDWTLVVSSGPHGDKLPVGFRSPAHAPLDAYSDREQPAAGPDEGRFNLGMPACDLLVVASGTNALAAHVLKAPRAWVRMFAPSLRNMLDTDPPVASFVDDIDILACNRREWETLPEADRACVESRVWLLSVTDGASGAEVGFRDRAGALARVRVPAFPRDRPPVDTNRAGEAFASTLVKTLLEPGSRQRPLQAAEVDHAARRASAAAALVLDIEHFGFPTDTDIDAALARGRVE